MAQLNYLPLWERALEHEIGIVVETNEPNLLRAELYKARANSKDPKLDEVILFIPSSNDRVFMARKSVELS